MNESLITGKIDNLCQEFKKERGQNFLVIVSQQKEVDKAKKVFDSLLKVYEYSGNKLEVMSLVEWLSIEDKEKLIGNQKIYTLF